MGLFRRLFHRKPPSDTETVTRWRQSVGEPGDADTLYSERIRLLLRAKVETVVGEPSDGETVVSERVEWRGSDGETAVGEPSDGETVVSEPVRWRRSYGKTVVGRPQSVGEQSDSKTVVGEPSDGETVVSEPIRWRRSDGRTAVQRPQSVGKQSDGETVVSEPVQWRRSDGRTVVQRAQSVGDQSDAETVVSDRVIRRRYVEALVGEPSDDETVARWRQSVGETVISERVQRRRSDGETVVCEQWDGETVVSERVRWRRSNGKTVVRRPRSVGEQSDGQTVVSERIPWRPSDLQTVVAELSDGQPLYCDPSCSEPLDNLIQISDRVYVFDSCFSTNVLEEDESKYYMDSTLGMLQCCFPDAAFMAFNFRRGNHRDQISDILSEYNVKLMGFPTDYGGFPLLPLQMIRNFLWSSVSWLLLEGLSGMNNVLLLHCERGGWPVLAFMLAALLLYRGYYNEEQKTLEMVYKLAPRELLPLPLPLNPQPSHLRYLRYITSRDSALGWPPMDKPFNLECLVLNMVPDFDGEGGCRPMVRVYGQDPSTPANGCSKLLFSTLNIWYYRQEEFTIMKLNVCCHVQGDVVIQCIHLDEDLEHEEMMFRFMFNTAFVQSDVLLLNREEIDVAWNAKDQFQEDFKVEILTFPLEVYGNGHLGMGDSRSQYRDNAGKVLDDSTSSSDCNYPPTPATQVFHSEPLNSKETIAETAKQLDEATKLLAPRTQRSSPAALEDGLVQFEKDIKHANSAVKSNISKLITSFKRLEVAKSQQSVSGDEPLSTAEIHSRKNQTDPSNGKVDHSSNKLNHAVLASANDKDTVSVPLLDGRGAPDLATTPTSIGAPVSLPKVDEGFLSPDQFDPQQNDRADLEHMRCQVKLGEEMQESSCTNEEGAHVLHPVCITSPAYLIEKVGESLQVENTAPEMEENPGEIISEHQESTIGESAELVIHSSVGKIDLSNLQEMDNEDLMEIKELGSGGFGTVYHGKWRGIDVAIKRIKKSCIVDEQSGQDRLILESLREAGILSKVQHPNVVSLHGFVLHESASTLAIVMELVRGGSLRSILHRGEKYLDHCKKLIIAKGAASGMEYLHLKNIVHFDLKCDNLLVDLKDPSWPICKVTDFGLSKIKENSLVSGSFRGTLPWMAPELFKRGNNKVSEKVDVYSFGVVMWEILTGQVPYAGMLVGDILGGICDDTLRPPVPASCDPKWRGLMEECWHRDPPQRPSFAEISSRLHWMLMVSQAEASK